MSEPVRWKPNPIKEAIKLVAHGCCIPFVLPVLIQYWLARPLFGPSRALEGATQTLAGVPGALGIYFRRAFLSFVLKRCSRSAEIGYGTLLSQPDSVIGDRVYIGPRCHLGLVNLEADVLLAAGVHVPSGAMTHHFDDPDVPIREQGGERQLVTIGAGAWIGSGAIVLADVGAGTIVGAGSVVTKPLPANVIAAGAPAKVIRNRFPAPDETPKSNGENL